MPRNLPLRVAEVLVFGGIILAIILPRISR